MKRHTVCVLALMLVLSASGEFRAQQGARISGWTLTDGGAVLPYAEVLLACPPNPPCRTVSNDRGLFVLDQVPPGNCTLRATKHGYVDAVAQGDPGITNLYNIRLTPGSVREGYELTLPLGVVVTGRIAGADGQPPRNVHAYLIRREFRDGRERLISTVGRPVGAGGEFAAPNLPAGEYLLAALPRPKGSDAGGSSGHAVTYFPGTPNFADAQRFSLRPGESKDVTFRMARTPALRIMGAAFDAVGAPLADAQLQLTTATAPGWIRGSVRTTTDGKFVMTGVPPGDYVIRILGHAPKQGEAVFTVTDSHVAGLVVRLGRRITHADDR